MLNVGFTLNIAYGQKGYHNRKYTAQRSQWQDYAHSSMSEPEVRILFCRQKCVMDYFRYSRRMT